VLITYRRTGSALGLMAVALAVTVSTAAVAAVAVIAVAVLAPVVLLARAINPVSRRSRRARSTSPWPQETIEHDLLRLDSDKG
jgi:hypothetical protein